MIIKDRYGIYHEINLKASDEIQFIQAGKWHSGIVDLFEKEQERKHDKKSDLRN